MPDYESRTVTTTRQEYALRSPSNWAEVEKVLAAVKRDLSGRRTFDNDVTAEARDGEIVFWYEVAPDA
jgi:hypothetical protein